MIEDDSKKEPYQHSLYWIAEGVVVLSLLALGLYLFGEKLIAFAKDISPW